MKKNRRCPFCVILGIFILVAFQPSSVQAQNQKKLAADDYAQAEKFLRQFTSPLVFGASVRVTWIEEALFWYRNSIPEGYEFVLADAKKGGVSAKEGWVKDDHGIMLPAQFVKEIGKELREFEVGLLGTDPLYASNAAKSPKEKEMLAALASGKEQVITGEDGGKTIGMSADYAIVDSCASCHNEHPKTTKKDWKKGDFMGAIVVRMK